MSSPITTLAPTKLWQWFDTICRIPHGSYNEHALAEYIVNWATSKNLAVVRDGVGNVIITKPATDGYQDRQPIALQAHLDMVCQSNGDYDFATQPIVPIIDGDWVRADGTTLGADNGIGMASILAVLDSDDLAHPTIEALFTMTEETGMDGAKGLSPDVLTAKLMINTDTEEIGEIYLGCAGGVDADIHLPASFETLTDECLIQCSVLGLKGGHSGIDIHKNNANAIKLLAYALSNQHIRLVSLTGGTARNAIPRMATAVVAINNKDNNKDDFIAHLHQISQDISTLVGGFETGITWQITDVQPNQQSTQQTALSIKDSQKIINLINAIPNGVLRYSDKVADTVETSLSLGKISLDDKGVHITSLIRSLNHLGKNTAMAMVQSVCELAGANVVFSGDYIGWNPNPSSAITALTKQIYGDIIGHEPALKVIHAGLECGLIQDAYPEMDIVSIGPTIKNAHSPDECVHIGSVATYWQVLTGILANSPKR